MVNFTGLGGHFRPDSLVNFVRILHQQRVPKSFLEELIIPIPPFSIQKKISDNMNNMKSRKKQMKIDANLLKELANQEFEQEIFKPLD